MPVTIGNLAAISILLGGGIVMCVPPPPDDLGDPLTPQEQVLKC